MHHIQKLNRFSFVYRKFYDDEINFSLHFPSINIMIDQDFKLDIYRVSLIEMLIEQFPMLKKQFTMWELVVKLTHSPYSLSSLTYSLSHSLPHLLI